MLEAAICLNFLERIKNMSKIQKAVSEIKSIEELANEDRWVNQVHPLVKLCVTILYIGTVVSFSKYNLSGLLVMAVYPVILFIMNDISVKDRVLFFIRKIQMCYFYINLSHILMSSLFNLSQNRQLSLTAKTSFLSSVQPQNTAIQQISRSIKQDTLHPWHKTVSLF